jgi:hypothetical protein
MGREQLAALIAILEAENAKGTESLALGTWTIHYDKGREAFVLDKCENDGYCEERPVVVATDGRVLDPGGPLFG